MDDNFYATTLDSTNKSVKWDVVGDTKEFPNPFYKLIIRQFLLGHTAKADEYNVVEVETVSVNETVKIPVAVLKVGESRALQPELEFPYGPVTFTLIEGNGPVYIHGLQVPSGYEEQVIESGEEFGSDEELEEEDFEEDADKLPPSKKSKLINNKNTNSKKK